MIILKELREDFKKGKIIFDLNSTIEWKINLSQVNAIKFILGINKITFA